MNITKHLLTGVLLASFTIGTINIRAAEKTKPYPLDKCVVSDEKLGEHGKPYTFTSDGQEVKLCCKDCLKDFKKDKAKYLKKIQDVEKEKK